MLNVQLGHFSVTVPHALADNPKAVADFKASKAKVAQAIKGAMIRETKGTAQPEIVEQIILEELQKVEWNRRNRRKGESCR